VSNRRGAKPGGCDSIVLDYTLSREFAVVAAEFGWRMSPISAALTVRRTSHCHVLSTTSPTPARLDPSTQLVDSRRPTHVPSARLGAFCFLRTCFQHPGFRTCLHFRLPSLSMVQNGGFRTFRALRLCTRVGGLRIQLHSKTWLHVPPHDRSQTISSVTARISSNASRSKNRRGELPKGQRPSQPPSMPPSASSSRTFNSSSQTMPTTPRSTLRACYENGRGKWAVLSFNQHRG
jgi:hypothetical protein